MDTICRCKRVVLPDEGAELDAPLTPWASGQRATDARHAATDCYGLFWPYKSLLPLGA